MDINESLSKKEIKLRQWLDSIDEINGIDEPEDPETAYEMLMQGKGHVDKHIDESDRYMIQRMISKGLYCSTSFKDTYSAVQHTLDALWNYCPNIVSWLEKSRDDFKHKESYSKMVIENSMGIKTSVGSGFDRGYNKIETNCIKIVLRRDPESEKGFHVITACPDISKEDGIISKTKPYKTKELIEDIIQPKRYLEKSLLFKLPELPENIHVKYSNKMVNGKHLTCIFMKDEYHPELGAEIRRNEIRTYKLKIDPNDKTDVRREYTYEPLDDYPDLKREAEGLMKTYEYIYENDGKLPLTKEEKREIMAKRREESKNKSDDDIER